MNKPSFRRERLEGLIKEEAGRLLCSSLSDRRLAHISVTRVELSADFSRATLYWDSHRISSGDAGQEELQRILEPGAKWVRANLAKVITTRKIPQVRFAYDSSFADEQAICRLLQS